MREIITIRLELYRVQTGSLSPQRNDNCPVFKVTENKPRHNTRALFPYTAALAGGVQDDQSKYVPSLISCEIKCDLSLLASEGSMY